MPSAFKLFCTIKCYNPIMPSALNLAYIQLLILISLQKSNIPEFQRTELNMFFKEVVEVGDFGKT